MKPGDNPIHFCSGCQICYGELIDFEAVSEEFWDDMREPDCE